MLEDSKPGEWLKEPGRFGKKYRIVNGRREYEMMIRTADGEIPESMIADYNQCKQEQMAARIAQERDKPKTAYCPFFRGGGTCRRERCALFVNGACALASLGDAAAVESDGKICPFVAGACKPDCALCKGGGCIITKICL